MQSQVRLSLVPNRQGASEPVRGRGCSQECARGKVRLWQRPLTCQSTRSHNSRRRLRRLCWWSGQLDVRLHDSCCPPALASAHPVGVLGLCVWFRSVVYRFDLGSGSSVGRGSGICVRNAPSYLPMWASRSTRDRGCHLDIRRRRLLRPARAVRDCTGLGWVCRGWIFTVVQARAKRVAAHEGSGACNLAFQSTRTHNGRMRHRRPCWWSGHLYVMSHQSHD